MSSPVPGAPAEVRGRLPETAEIPPAAPEVTRRKSPGPPTRVSMGTRRKSPEPPAGSLRSRPPAISGAARPSPRDRPPQSLKPPRNRAGSAAGLGPRGAGLFGSRVGRHWLSGGWAASGWVINGRCGALVTSGCLINGRVTSGGCVANGCVANGCVANGKGFVLVGPAARGMPGVTALREPGIPDAHDRQAANDERREERYDHAQPGEEADLLGGPGHRPPDRGSDGGRATRGPERAQGDPRREPRTGQRGEPCAEYGDWAEAADEDD